MPEAARAAALGRWLAVRAGAQPLERLLPGQAAAAGLFAACLGAWRGGDLHVHALLEGLEPGEAALRAERLRRSLQLEESAVPGRIHAAVWLLAPAGAPEGAYLDFEDAHFLAKTLVGRGRLLPGAAPRYAGRARPLPGAAELAAADADPSSDPGEAAQAALAEREAEAAGKRRQAAQAMRLLKPGPTPATWTLLALNLAAYALQLAKARSLAAQGEADPFGRALLLLGANDPALTLGAGQWWRALASACLHSGFLHLGLNLLSLYALGTVLERLAGPWRLLLLYALAALAGGLLSAAWHQPGQASVGASGAVLGLGGALLAPRFRAHGRFPEALAQRLFDWLARPLGLTLGLGLALELAGLPAIDNAAHLGGLLAGFTLGYLFPSFLVRPTRPRT